MTRKQLATIIGVTVALFALGFVVHALLFVLLLLLAIALHEFGHFATAKKFGIKVDKFFIGFGPKIWSVRHGETEYGFNWIPAGGYVRIAGMNPFEEISAEDRARTFKAKKPWQRAIVLAAGSTMHFIIAFVVLAVLFMAAGTQDPTTKVDQVSPDTPAAAAGLRPGDRVVAVAGAPVDKWAEVRDFIRAHPGQTISLTVARGSERTTVLATLASQTPDKEPAGFLGVQPSIARHRRNPAAAVGESVVFLGEGAWQSLDNLYRIVSPSSLKHLYRVLQNREKRTESDPASIVGVTQVAGGAGLVDLLFIFVGFNVFVGVVNLLPLLPLDGGHLAVLAWEKISRREVDMRKLIPVTATVVTLLVGLFLISLYLDLVQPIKPG